LPVVVVNTVFNAKLRDAIFGADPAKSEARKNTLAVLIEVFSAVNAADCIGRVAQIADVAGGQRIIAFNRVINAAVVLEGGDAVDAVF
jgi:hypothetical protein